jgi:hypothetical protein
MNKKTTGGEVVEFFGLKFGLLDPRTLTAHPLNYRTHPEKQKAALRASIAEHGYVQFPIYNLTTRRLIDGHARVEDACKEGVEAMPVLLVEKDEVSEKRLLASLDRIGEQRGHDEALLARLLQDTLADSGTLPAGWVEDDLGDLLLKLDREGTVKLGVDGDIPVQPKPSDGSPAPLPEDGEEETGPATRQPSSVKQISLFLTTESEPEFQELVRCLGEQFGTTNTTDTVLHALRLVGMTELGLGEDEEETE